MPKYLLILKEYKTRGLIYCSASIIADAISLSNIQVRKDLALVSNHTGVPNQGRNIQVLIDDIEEALGRKIMTQAILVGVGMLGQALLSYKGFKAYGVNIVIGFDKQVRQPYSIRHTPVYNIDTMETLIKGLSNPIGIITVPKEAAQDVCDLLVRYGVKAIWNFAPVRLSVPKDIILHNEDMAESLALISTRLIAMRERNDQKKFSH
jgi:redox-sensing transcriptional repressor